MSKLLPIFIALTLNSCMQGQVEHDQTKINLSGLHLKSIPDSIFDCKNLTYLDLGSSEVVFYPPLSALVDSNANELTELPDKIERLTNLKTLILNSNKLTTLPATIDKLTNLEVLDLSINKDLDIINEIDKINKLPKLRILKIIDVKLSRDDLDILRKSLRQDIRIVISITEYFEKSD
jgi:Leucine-rich repeat (LRR) protein